MTLCDANPVTGFGVRGSFDTSTALSKSRLRAKFTFKVERRINPPHGWRINLVANHWGGVGCFFGEEFIDDAGGGG